MVPEFDLGQVEDLVDQGQQVVARGVDRGGILHLLRGQVLSPFSESRRERISMLFSGVRSSCDMLARNSRLVRRSARTARPSPPAPAWPARSRGSCALPRGSVRRAAAPSLPAPRWSAAAPPAAPSAAPRRRSDARLLFQSPVRLLELLLLVLQLLRQRLGLLQQLLSAHVRGEGVQDDADALRELVEERQVGVAEPVEGSQLDRPRTSPSNSTGSTAMLGGAASPDPSSPS